MMKIRSNARRFPGNLPARPTPARAIEDAHMEQGRVLKRLRALIEAHQENAVRLNVRLEMEDVMAVVDALVAEAERGDPCPILKHSNEIQEYARFTLYQEMLEEPSNVLLATPVNATTIRYEAMPRTFWLDCLRALRREWGREPRATDREGTTPSPETEEQA